MWYRACTIICSWACFLKIWAIAPIYQLYFWIITWSHVIFLLPFRVSKPSRLNPHVFKLQLTLFYIGTPSLVFFGVILFLTKLQQILFYSSQFIFIVVVTLLLRLSTCSCRRFTIHPFPPVVSISNRKRYFAQVICLSIPPVVKDVM